MVDPGEQPLADPNQPLPSVAELVARVKAQRALSAAAAKPRITGRTLNLKALFARQLAGEPAIPSHLAQAAAPLPPPASTGPPLAGALVRFAESTGLLAVKEEPANSSQDEQPATPDVFEVSEDPGSSSLVAQDAEPGLSIVLQDAALAEFPVPDVPARRPTLDSLAMQANSSPAAKQAGPRGKQGLWRPGPGRPPQKDKDSACPGIQKEGRRKALQSGAAPLRWDSTPEQKHHICQQITAHFKRSAASRRKTWDKWSRELGCTPATVRKMYDNRLVWEEHVKRAGPVQRDPHSGLPLGRPVKTASLPAQKRKRQVNPARGYLGTTDFLHEERRAVAAWAKQEEENGHSLGRSDLFRQFKILTAHKQKVLQEAAQRLAEEGQELPDFETKALEFCNKRLEAWLKPKAREKAAKKLLAQTGHRERRTNWRTKLSPEQETEYLHKAWRFFDFLSWLVANGSVEELSDFFAMPEQFRQNYKSTALLFTDQIPVWLKVDSGATVISEEKLSNLRAGQKQRRARRQVAAKRLAALVAGRPVPQDEMPQEPSGKQAACYLTRGPGSTEAARWRISLLARQVIEDFWDPAKTPVGDHFLFPLISHSPNTHPPNTCLLYTSPSPRD